LINTLFIGQHLIELASVDSTNSHALRMSKDQEIVEGTLVWAHEQTCGRGQRGNSWQSESFKNITLSIILRPGLRVEQQFYMTRVVSLGLLDALKVIRKETGHFECRIKWPNDIYAGDKKIAGILIENVLKEDKLGLSIAGIGLNVNQTTFEGLTQATSLQTLTGQAFDLEHCIGIICENIEARYLSLKANKLGLLRSDYENYLYRLNEWHSYEKDGRPFLAELTGVNDQGKLLLKQENGAIYSYDLKEIKFCI
jgi:BirA family biotin operon repressor/biotin-[acetyl-CoA-carboxylase] ligase